MIAFSKEPLGISAAARELKLSESRVRQLAASGRLRTIRTTAGQYLFDPADVARFARQRMSEKTER